ncbi:MAG: hypothetical protein AAB770_01195 [Patescibacteria group bacterium]
MNTKIKLFSATLIALTGLFGVVNFAYAQSVTITTCTSATVNGTITSTSGGVQTSAWFEWGTSYVAVDSGAGTDTSTQTFSTPQDFSQLISGLSPSTTYYYRAVVSNTYGTAQGGTRSFNTPACSVPPPVVTLPTVSTNSASSVLQNSATLNGYVTSNGANVNTWFEWGTNYSLGNTTSNVNYGNTATSFSNSLFNLNANTTYYYRAVAQNSQGTVQGSILSFTTSGQYVPPPVPIPPYVSTNSASSVLQNSATLNGYVTSSGTNTSAWFEWGTSYSLGNSTSYNSYGTGAISFNSSLYNLNPNTTYYYRAVAQSSYGIVYGSILSFTTTGQTYVPPPVVFGFAPTASTLLATELTGTTAKLNGLVFTSGNLSSSAWFEWGVTSSLGNTTQTINVGALPVVKHSDFITGLTNGQTYYYRVVAENSYGKSYGGVNTFVSETNTYVVTPPPVRPVVLRPTTTVITRGSSAQSLASLSIEGGAEMIGSGEKRTYRVTWKNDSTQPLKNVVLRVTFPQSMNVDSATKGSFSSSDNSVIVDLKTLAPKEEGDTFIFATSGRGLKPGELLVVTANMVYTGINGVQGDAIAYVTHRAEAAQNAIGANIFGAGDFVPTTLFGWILLMILVLVLVLLGNHLYGRFSESK